jgi:hypothetical protein
LVVGFGSLNQAVQLSTGRRALGSVAKQPVLSSDNEGAVRAFSDVIVERQVAFLDVLLQLAPITCEITNSFVQGILSGDPLGSRQSVQQLRLAKLLES